LQMKLAASYLALSTAILLTACGGGNSAIAPVSAASLRGPAGDYPMVLGDPFIVDGVTYTPADIMNYDSVGYAEPAEGDGIIGAHRTLPLPSYVEVTSLDTGRTILVRLTQRGPMQGGHLLALSPQAWAQLGQTPAMQIPVRVRRVNPPEAERALLRAGAQVSARMDTPPGLLAVLKRKLGIASVPVPAPVASPVPADPVVEKVPAPKAVAKVEPKPKAAIADKPAAVAKAPPPSSKGMFIQVGAYSTRERAETVAKALSGSATQVGKVWRVRTGPHKDRGQADAALAKARAAGYADARVVTAP
ncbi:SPOR domain-containing protein, partial [Novosphingobium sp.]|uniref:SPOR domain-containing protein n=1 Tax=Novosphingobium sp. TaxID=1874826 RepID=UPI0035668C90